MRRSLAYPYPQAGFSLLELSAVLAIIAVLTAGTFSMGSSVIESARRVNTDNKLDAIEEALLAFRLANNRLPCPGDATQTDTPAFAVTYGYEAGSNAANNPINSCTGGSPAANFSYTVPQPPAAVSFNTNIPGGTIVAEGTVPVKSLGLPDEFQWDGWGRKFAYAVWTPLTATNAFITYGLSPNCGAIAVENAGGGNRTTSAAYALISFGPNGHGGYLKSGARYFMGTEDNAAEKTNCHCNGTADTGYAATYVEQEPTQTNPNDSYSVFDDIVRFKDRWQMQNAYDTYTPNGAPCWPGLQAKGVTAGDEAGYSVAVGDVNGDGIPDLIIGAPYASPGANTNAGVVYVVFGTKSGFPDPLPLNNLNGNNGFELDGVLSRWRAGDAVTIGDINGDGIPDIIIGAYDLSLTSSGAVYVVFGGNTGANNSTGTPWTSCTSASPCLLQSGGSNFLNGTNGFELDGMGAGYSVATGDVNGDGIPDLIIGAPYAWPGGSVAAGSVYVVFGKKTGWASQTTLTSGNPPLDGANGAEFDGAAAGDLVGFSVASGDVNGDGISDIMIGAYSKNSVYVVFGQKSVWASQTTLTSGSPPLDGTHGVEFDGTGGVGAYVASGDINGDGISDLIMGVPGINSNAGGAYVVFGNKTWSRSSYTLDDNAVTGIINGTNGIEFEGGAGAYAGVVAAGDVNGDGIPDIVIGAPRSGGNAGSAYVVFGGKTGANNSTGTSWTSCTFASPCLLQSGVGNFLNGTNGFELDGVASRAGYSVAVGGINGDGIPDLIIGAPTANSSGSTYVYFGHKNTTADPWPTIPFNLGGL